MTRPPTVFCLPGLGLSARAFDQVAAGLDGDFRVVALDLPGFGGTSTVAGTTVEEMAAYVTQVVRDSGASRWLLVGHSMGGKVASVVVAATLSGENGLFGLAGVVLLAGSPPTPEPMEESRRAEMITWAQAGPLSREHAREFVDANTGAALPPEPDTSALADLARTSPEAWVDWLERGSREDWSSTVGVLDVPAVLVAGGSDGDLGPANQRRLNGPVYPRARLRTLEGAGHLLPYERPDEVARIIRTFWEEDAGRAPVLPEAYAGLLASAHTSARTRGIMARRALADDPRYEPQVLTRAQLATLRAVADRVVPQDGSAIDLAARVDTDLAAGRGDGWRNAAMPPDGEAYASALDALAGFAELAPDEQDERLTSLADGSTTSTTSTDGGLDAAQLALWFEDARTDLVRAWLAHPASLARIGFDGYSNGGDGVRMRGFQRIGAGQRDGWEPELEVVA